MISNMEVQLKQRCGTEFLYVEKNGTTDIHRHLLNTGGEQTVDMSTKRIAHFSSGKNGLLLPLQIFTRAAFRLLLISGENAELMVVTVLDNSVL